MNIVLGALTFSASEGGHARIKEKQQQRKESQFNYSFFSWKDVPPHLPNPLFCRFNNFCVCVRCWKHNLKVTTLLKYDKQVNLGTNMSNLLVTKATFSNSISVSWTEQISEVHSDGFWAQEGLKMEFFCCWRCEEEEEIMLRVALSWLTGILEVFQLITLHASVDVHRPPQPRPQRLWKEFLSVTHNASKVQYETCDWQMLYHRVYWAHLKHLPIKWLSIYIVMDAWKL